MYVFKDALSKQADEAVRIKSRKSKSKSKSEFNHPPIARIVVEKSKNKYSAARAKLSPSL